MEMPPIKKCRIAAKPFRYVPTDIVGEIASFVDGTTWLLLRLLCKRWQWAIELSVVPNTVEKARFRVHREIRAGIDTLDAGGGAFDVVRFMNKRTFSRGRPSWNPCWVMYMQKMLYGCGADPEVIADLINVLATIPMTGTESDSVYLYYGDKWRSRIVVRIARCDEPIIISCKRQMHADGLEYGNSVWKRDPRPVASSEKVIACAKKLCSGVRSCRKTFGVFETFGGI